MRLTFKRDLTGNVDLEKYQMVVTGWDIHMYCETKIKPNPAALIISELRETLKLAWENLEGRRKSREKRWISIRFQKDFKWTG